MPRNGSGQYELPPENPVATDTVIESSWANNTMSDLATEMTQSLDRNGRGSMLAALKIIDGTVSAPGLSFLNEPNSGFYRHGARQLAVALFGVEKARFSETSLAVKTALECALDEDAVGFKLTAPLANTVNQIEIYKDTTLSFSVSADGVPVADTDAVRKKELDVTDAAVTGVANDLAAHEGDLANPHQVTAAQTGAYTQAEVDQAIADAIAALPADELLHIQNRQASGVDGGSTVAGVWTKRTLNTAVTNEIAGASLANDVVTLPAGTYYLEGSGYLFMSLGLVGRNGQHRIRDTTGNATLCLGMPAYQYANYGAAANMLVAGKFTLSVQSNIEFQYFSPIANAGDGQGLDASTGEANVFADLRIWKRS